MADLNTLLLAGGVAGAAFLATRDSPVTQPAPNAITPNKPVKSKLKFTSGFNIGQSTGQKPPVIDDPSRREYTESHVKAALELAKKEFQNLTKEAKQAGCKALNESVLKDNPKKLSCDETFEEVMAVVGAAAGTALGNSICGPICGSLGAIAGAYLGKALGEYLEDAYDEVEDWASDQWDSFEDGAEDAWNDAKDWIGGL